MPREEDPGPWGHVLRKESSCWQVSNSNGHRLGRVLGKIYEDLLAVVDHYQFLFSDIHKNRKNTGLDSLELCSLPNIFREHRRLESAIMWSLLNLLKNSTRAELGRETEGFRYNCVGAAGENGAGWSCI